MLAQLVTSSYFRVNKLTYCTAVWSSVVFVFLMRYAGFSKLLSLDEAETSSNIFTLPPFTAEYILDFEKLSLIREKNMKRYTFNYNTTGIDKRTELSLEEFRDIYDCKWPDIITDVVPSWPAFNWTSRSLLQSFGNDLVSVKAVHKLLDAAIDVAVKFSFNDIPSTNFEDLNFHEELSPVSLMLPLTTFYQQMQHSSQMAWTYATDELFILKRPRLLADIGHSRYTEDDLFHLFPEKYRPWNAMFLWGSSFSRSTLHIDPNNWTGTNAVIYGRKRWKLYPPGQDTSLNVIKDQMSGFPLNCFKYNSRLDAFREHPFDSHISLQNITSIDFVQNPGEMLIIPTGWFHQAFNVEETLAISGQVMNINNYRIILEEIIRAHTIDRRRFPANMESFSLQEQIQAVLDLLPKNVIQR